MRAPPERFVAYTEAQWDRITFVLARIGIDANRLMLSDARWWVWEGFSDHPYTMRRLREQLEDFGRHWTIDFLPAEKELAAVETVLENSAISCQARAELEALAAKLRPLASEPPLSPSALKWKRAEYFQGLIILWRMFGGSRRRVDQIRFLHACASPVFPSITRGAVRNFLDRMDPETRIFLEGIERVSIE